MNASRTRELIRRALDCLEQAAAECQSELNERASASLEQNPGPTGIGQLTALSRRNDTIERCARDLYDLLDQPPPSLRRSPQLPNIA